jgi:hypothetical protein
VPALSVVLLRHGSDRRLMIEPAVAGPQTSTLAGGSAAAGSSA